MNTDDASQAAFNRQAEAIVRQYCRGVQELTFIEHSADNLILIADRSLVFRFPRNDLAVRRLYFESALLQRIAGKIPAVTIPVIREVNDQPSFAVAAYIEGMHLANSQIWALGNDEQADIGRTIATFMAAFQQAVSGAEVRQLRHDAKVQLPYGPWEQYFRRLFIDEPLPDNRLRPFIVTFYRRWQDFVPHENRTVAIHDDLHLRNLLFRNSTLTGILDFGDANIGGVEEELRWVYMMGDTVLTAAIAQYRQLTGVVADYQQVRVWAIMHELAAFVHGLSAGKTQQYPFRRAKANLQAWLPAFPA